MTSPGGGRNRRGGGVPADDTARRPHRDSRAGPQVGLRDQPGDGDRRPGGHGARLRGDRPARPLLRPGAVAGGNRGRGQPVEGELSDEWGEYGAGWEAARFDAAMAAPPGSSERDQLVGALLRTHYRALPGQARATAEGFVPFDAGLDAISRHAKGLGYDAVILFLDELVLWLAARMSDVAFVSREGAKIVKLVEADAAARPAPIVSFIARQRDLRELVGEHVPGAQSLSAIDILRHSEGRFDTITLEDRNLPAIAEQRLLRPRTEQARQQLDDAFEKVRRELEERQERDVLLTQTGDLAAFRRLYPFSPALVDSLVALSGAMQRERT